MRAATRLSPPAIPARRAVWAAVMAGCGCFLSTPAPARAPGVTPPPNLRPSKSAQSRSAQTEPAKATTSQDAKPAASKRKQVDPPRPDLPAIPAPPDDGPLTRSDLIQLGIQSHPDFWRFRGEVAYYLQAEEAAYDWQDPELRVGFDHEFESELRRPYTESSSFETTERGYFDTTTRSFFTESDGIPPNPFTYSGSTFERERTRQDRYTRAERVRKVRPGKYESIIDETVYEVERRNESSRRSQAGPESLSENRKESEKSNRRVVSRSRERRRHPNDVYGNDQVFVTVRFFIPNPMDMRARAARARAEAGLSSQRMRTELRDLVFDVGRRYDELQYRHAWHQANLRLLDLMQRNLKEIEQSVADLGGAAAGIANLFDPIELPRARLEVSKAREEVFDSSRRLALVKEELGLLCGIDDPSRILLTNTLRLRQIDQDRLDLVPLVELARIHRPDLGEMKARGEVERARLREVKVARIPWIQDLRVGYVQTTADGYRDQDEITALLTFNLPLFSWWQNKAHRQHEEAMANFEEAHRLMGQRIDNQVAFAIRSVHEAAQSLEEFNRGETLLREDLKKNSDEARIVGGDRGKRILLASEEQEVKSGRGRLQALYHYNQAVAHLELAIGIPIEEAFAPATPAESK